MIDFRYHLVSLVSVFIALAVGVVLGAGPLRGEIADQLSARVDQLSAEKNQLRTERDIAAAAVENRDQFTTALVPTLVAGRLQGRTVVLISLPDAKSDALDPLTRALQAAGASVSGQIRVENAWWDEAHVQDRAEVVKDWASLLGTPQQGAAPAASTSPARPSGPPSPTAPSGSPPAGADVLDALLARGLVTSDPTQVGLPDQVGKDLLAALDEHGLVTVRGAVDSRADLAVLLVPGLDLPSNGASPPTKPQTHAEDWAALALALDRADRGTVVVGPASAALDGGDLAALRDQSADRPPVSTVDTGGTPMGDVTTVFALVEQRRGGGGAYGFGKGATAPFPEEVLQ